MGEPEKIKEKPVPGGLFPFLIEILLPDGAAIKAELQELTQKHMDLHIGGSINDGLTVQVKLQFRCDDIMEVSEIVSGRVIHSKSPKSQENTHRIRIALDAPLTPQTHPVLYTHLEHPPSPATLRGKDRNKPR